MKGMIDIPKTAPGNQGALAKLDEANEGVNKVLCVVYGEGADVDGVAKSAADLAGKTQCGPVRVVRVRNDAILGPKEKDWKPSDGKGLTLLKFDGSVSKVMTVDEASDAGDLFVAMIDAIAGLP